MAVRNVKAGPLTWGSLSSRLYREPMDNSVLNYSYTDLLWELNQVDNTYNPGHGTGGMNNYYVGMITSVPYVNQENGKGKNESNNLRGPWYITYCATDDNEGTGRYAFTGHIEDTAIALNTYYADRIVLRQELDYAMQSGSVAPWQLGTYYTGVGMWYDAYMEAKTILDNGGDLPDETYFHTTTYSEIFNDYAYNVAIGNYGHAEGIGTNTYGGHAEGYNTTAGDENNQIENEKGVTATHAEGINTKAIGIGGHAEGCQTTAEGDYSHTEGFYTHVYKANGHAEGNTTNVHGDNGHAEGANTMANGSSSHAEGENSIAQSNYSHAEGKETYSQGDAAHAEGCNTSTYGNYSHTEGYSSLVNGMYSHAEGAYTYIYSSYSHAEGCASYALGTYSHVEGKETYSQGESSHAEGYNTYAFGNRSHAEGSKTKALGHSSHAEGDGSKVEEGGVAAHAEGCSLATAALAHAEGDNTEANGHSSHAEGFYNIVNSERAHVEGMKNTINDNSMASHAEGGYNNVTGKFSHVEGSYTKTIGDSAHAEGYNSYALANYSHVEGDTNTAYEDAIGSHIEGQYNNSHGKYSHIEGTYNILEANATYAHVEGIFNHVYTSGSHAEGYNTKSIGTYTHSENAFTEAIGAFSHAEGWASKSGGDSSHAEGFFNISYGFASHSEGVNTKAIGNFSHAEGMGGSIVTELADGNIAFSYEDLLANKAEGIASHVEGHINLAYGDYSHTQGTYSTTYGEASFSSGYGVQAYSSAETAIGKWNKSSKDDNNIFTIGDGSDNNNRHNIMSVYSSVINGQYKSIVNVDGYDTYINNSNSTNITSPITYINSKTATYITYGDNNTIASYVDENGVTYAIDTYSGNLSYVVTYKQFAAAYSSIYHSIDGAISNLPPSVKSIDEFTRDTYTNTLNYTTQSIDPNDNKKWIDTAYTVTIESANENNAGLLSSQDKKYLNEIVTGDKVLVDKVTITTNKVDLYTYDSSTKTYKYIKTSTNLSFEDGYYIKWTGTWSWTHEDGKKDPESCESTQWGNTLPASGVQSETYTSDYINSTKEIARITIKAKKRGLVVSNGQVKLASVSGLADDAYPKSISCNRFFYMYYGASTTQNITADMISGFSVKTGTAKSNYQSLDVKTNSSQCFVLIYPKSFNQISTIKRDGVEVITNSFVLMNENGITITNTDGISHVYYVYATGIGTQSFSITVS